LLPPVANQGMFLHEFFERIFFTLILILCKMSQLERLRKILEDQHGIIRTSDLGKFDIPRTYLSIMEKNGEIERVSMGIYKKTASIEDELFSVQARYKSSIYSHETALYLHDLTDRTPLTYSMSVPVGYHSVSLKESEYKIYYVNRRFFGLGVVSIKSPHGNEVKTTGLERTIVDVLRSRNQMDIQLFSDALKRYVGGKEKDVDLLYNYAKKFRVQKIVRQYIEVLL
jgi:predicted transcriptional regulator of viral defense system